VYKRSPDQSVDLRTKHARAFFHEVKKRFPSFGFSLRSFENELEARSGVKDCVSKGLVDPYYIVCEKSGEIVAQYQWTVLISAKRVVLLTSHLMDEGSVKSEKSVSDE